MLVLRASIVLGLGPGLGLGKSLFPVDTTRDQRLPAGPIGIVIKVNLEVSSEV